MRLFAVGITHRTAPVELRECVDFARQGVETALAAIAERKVAHEVVVLSTCNRAEIYAGAESDAAADTLGRFIGEFHGIPWERLAPHVVVYRGQEAADHLFRVAAGLDSLVVGEPQILGQVKDAFQVAATRQCVGPVLTRLFHTSFGVGKRVRSETALGEGAISVGYAAVALARKIFGRLDGRGVLVVGAGEISTITAQHLRSQGVGEIVITSRTAAHADALAADVNGRAIPWNDMRGALAAADIVITATGSPRPILSRTDIAAVSDKRRGEPLFIIDIAVPRDVEASVGEIEQVFLYNVDDLQAVVQENLSRRSSEIGRAESIVSEEVERFAAWRRSRGAVPTVVALRQRFEQIRRAELQRLEHKLGGLSPEARASVDEVTRLIVEKLLLAPTSQLKALPDEDTQIAYTEAVNRLFELRDEAAAPVAPASDEVDAGPSNRTRS